MIQVAVFVPEVGDDPPSALVEMVQGDMRITVATLKPGDQGQFNVYDGTSIIVSEKETVKS